MKRDPLHVTHRLLQFLDDLNSIARIRSVQVNMPRNMDGCTSGFVVNFRGAVYERLQLFPTMCDDTGSKIKIVPSNVLIPRSFSLKQKGQLIKVLMDLAPSFSATYGDIILCAVELSEKKAPYNLTVVEE